MFIVKVNQMDIPVELFLKRSNRKIYLRVKNGIVHITTPTRLTMFTVEDMIRRNFNSIIKLMNEPKKVEEEIHFLGHAYPLEIRDSKVNLAYIDEDHFVLELTDMKQASKLVETFYKTALKKIVETYAGDIISKFDIPFEVFFRYKNAKGYYGECYPKRQEIILSTKLAKYELEYILSVIYHECAHFKYMNHQKEFYDYLEKRYPNYRKVQRKLRTIRYYDKY